MFTTAEVYDATFKIVPYMNNSFAEKMFANIQSWIGLKQFVIMASGCTTSSQCIIVTEFQINKTK